jgi:hypothetical protein
MDFNLFGALGRVKFAQMKIASERGVRRLAPGNHFGPPSRDPFTRQASSTQ